MPQGLTPSGKHALAPPAANISVNYTGFTPEAQAGRAVDIWSSLLIATVPIEIEANFDSVEDSDALAAARPSTWFCSTTVCAPVGLVNQLVDEGKPDDPDIETTFSSSDEDFGLDGRPGEDQHDFVSIALHEIAQAWDFMTASGSMNQLRKPVWTWRGQHSGDLRFSYLRYRDQPFGRRRGIHQPIH